MGKTSDVKKFKQNSNKTETSTKANNFKSKLKGKPNSKDDETKPKKVFDKKKWRLKKYNKQYQVQQWQDRKKKAVLREYYKNVKDESEFDVQKIYKQAEEEEERSSEEFEENQVETENENNLNRDIAEEQAASTSTDLSQRRDTGSKSNKKNAYKQAQNEFERLQREKQLQKEEAARIKAEKIEARKQYKAKKLEKYKLFNKKTKKGQPIMKHRMEMLLEQIQKSAQ